ncbi:sugar ABC transporter ATP-binding protein [Wansuia hejianensis]|uniref:Sugar ABC transporter ATP-binding protein n=1 Tax=Wansuia hejianensis TaxID=2763667 RepID=A0A7G9GCL6_9FIRM|nr:sugar ABC transporter ATP-binding protein [Wansuia hejianensis]QNM08548.1 sugar ABC transporter ATP-binding protein [Wansuia hejianensis]
MSILKTEKITKIYPGTKALDQITVAFDSGKVHAFIGKNGSGKSTLVKIFAGAIQPTEGSFYLDDEKIVLHSPQDAIERGIATVYQELSLVPGLTVAENILMGRLPMRGKLIDWKRTYQMADQLLREYRVDISAKEVVASLSLWQCQMVEIVKAMSTNPKVIMLDEPTSSLAKNEIELLFGMIRELKKKDVIIIYISHKLQELWQIADTCTVLRDGRFIGKTVMQETSRQELVKMMFGEVEVKTRPEDLKAGGKVMLKVEGLTRKGCFEDVSFEVREKEILGIAGMLGAGRTELLRAIFGVDRFDSGRIFFDGQEIRNPNPVRMKEKGFALTPEDRKNEGLIQMMSVYNNLCVASIPYLAKHKFIQRKKEKAFVGRQIEELQIKVPDADLPVSSLSGGNQQKVVVGNWLNTDPKIMFFDEPSRGIDVNAKQQIFQVIWEQSRKGISSIMVSSELEELLEVCHRILIMHEGRIVKEIFPEDVTVDELYTLCMG